MSEMVERVAQRLCQEEYGAHVWDIDFNIRPRFASRARAAIEAMREPTSAMCEASLKNDWTFADSVNSYAGPIERWRAMIDEALK